MTSTDLAAAKDRAAITRVYEVVYARSALVLQDKDPTTAKLHHATSEVAKTLADEAEDDAEALAMFLEAMREVEG